MSSNIQSTSFSYCEGTYSFSDPVKFGLQGITTIGLQGVTNAGLPGGVTARSEKLNVPLQISATSDDGRWIAVGVTHA
ncbi:hypothetical protein KC19_VG080100 [Ceratodon purpureus]|uniref:Uncharacterized protein n=1 Tax=Ceratodon purpureus TaxID=3225 RepID=A0A8T0HND2_CERPU|nr:hypothetical protein KC19_VG080100 [Ceratodon purpureus]